MKKPFIILFLILILPNIYGRMVPISQFQLTSEDITDSIALWDPPNSAIHIDPENRDTPNRNGTIENPYSSFDEVEWKDNNIYAIKRGTTLETNNAIVIIANHVTIASYGKGKRPKINSITEAHAISTNWEGSKNITIRDLEISAPKAVSCLIFRSNSVNSKAINLKLHGAEWGIRALNHLDGIYIYDCEITNVKDDGVFIKNSTNIEISHCKIQRVNQNWSPPYTSPNEAAGDGIQFEGCNHWHVHRNKIDRSDTGNKFCFISNNPQQDDGIFEYNLLIGPRDPGFSIYIGDGNNIIIRFNIITGPSNSPIYSHASNLKIHYNIFKDINGPLFASASAEVYNNLFYNTAMGIEGGTITARNNIFDFGANRTRFKVEKLTESNNLFVNGLPTRNSIRGNPHYIDPENNNFNIKSNSDCIDNGIDVGINSDIRNNSVPEGKAPDIGPFEYKPNR